MKNDKSSLSHSNELRRSLSLPLVTFYGIGTILGAGIYVLVGKVAGVAGMLTPLAFLVAALIAGFSAFSYAELAARLPKSASEAVYAQAGFGRASLSRLIGLLMVLVGVVSSATLMHGFAGYLQVYVQWPDIWVISVMILTLGAVVIWGVTQSVLIAVIMTLFEMAGLVLIIWVAGDSLGSLPERWPQLLAPEAPFVWYGVLLGAFVAFYAFIGFEDMVNVAEEVIDPSRNLPKAIILVLIIVTLFYLLVTLVSILSVAPDRLAQTDAPLAMVYEQATGRGPLFITLISLVSVLNGALIQIIMASRVLYGLSRQGWLPSLLGQVSGRTRTPVPAIIVVVTAILLFALLLPLISLARLTSFVTLIIFTLMNVALWRIKRREDSYEGFQVPLWVPVSGATVSALFLVSQLYDFFVD
ncbi:MAG: APC family permease [Thiohalophilus sp.]|uniref:APC family permease n=1 Tax=Thiohalophilus sp. TaxID=3028392 RepID=UPI00286FB212|nr:APC family permease [Thiohalophilus sp.]MDR9437520.1 APC family permease [Thiohalophilus sp.]